jgi:cephalosporin-C deacetylase-like acetyl esterase
MSVGNPLDGQLNSLDTDILSPDERELYARMLRDDVRARCKAANQRDAEAWDKVQSREDWEKFCAPRIEALKRSLGIFPAVPGDPDVHVTRTIEGEGYTIENLVYQSRASVWVTANLYMPLPLRDRMPVVIIVHSHHNPKTQGELQDMGMTWARVGCMVLVIEQPGYGEQRQHTPGSRQDYRFRYINGIQLHVIGDSLMGWMVWDIMRGVDLLLNREYVDKERVILMGAVAGGGDPAAVTAATDPRITCVIPFNFGGPQPETQYPLPDDAEETFNYMGYGYWESTRNLRLSGQDGFLPWVIVASVAPRHLIYAHEFSWDKERDPVWKRLQKVFALYDASDNLAFAHGAGVLTGRPPEATHCNNVGAVHRKMIYPDLERWFGIPVPEEYQKRFPEEELMCLTPELKEEIKPPALNALFAGIGATRAAEMRDSLTKLTPDDRRKRLRQKWQRLLGDIEPTAKPTVKSRSAKMLDSVRVESILLEPEPGIALPILGLLPPSRSQGQFPVVVALAQAGKDAFLKERGKHIAELLKKGIAVYLPDVRGTGETSAGSSREYQSEATSISATELMLGQTLLGSQLRDLRSALRYLGARGELDAQRIALWGDSFAATNPPDFADPLIGEEGSPNQSEPLGGLLALFGALYEESVCTAVVRGTIAGYQSVLRDRFCYIPYDAVVPDALTAGDLCDVAAALALRPLRLEALVDGRNRRIPDQELQCLFKPTLEAYGTAEEKLSLVSGLRSDLSEWLAESLNAPISDLPNLNSL